MLAQFPHLEELWLECQHKDIETLSHLTNLRKLTLRSMSLPDLSVLTSLERLWWLALKLGGTRDISPLPRAGSLKYLEIWRVRGLSDLSVIADVSSLQYLCLQALKHVTKLPCFRKLKRLRRVVLETIRGIRDLTPLLEAEALEELLVIDGRHMEPEDFRPLADHPTLRRVRIGLGSDRKNDALSDILPLESVPSRPFCFD